MRISRVLILVPVLAALVAGGCGDDDEPATKDASTTEPAIAVLDVDDCMAEAGFEEDAPPTGAIRAWRHPDGARAVSAAEETESVTTGIGDEIAGGQYEPVVDGSVVVAGPDATTRAALDCLT